MANSYNTEEKLWILNVDDILHSPSKGAICIRKIFFQCNSSADIVNFQMLSPETAATHDNNFVNLNFTSTNTITDGAGGGKWTSTNAGDWMLISDCSIADNDGWWYIITDSSDDIQVVENNVNIDGAHVFTNNGSGESARVRIYTPKTCMYMINDATTGIYHPTLDWGDRGRWFTNLSMQGFTGVNVYFYLR